MLKKALIAVALIMLCAGQLMAQPIESIFPDKSPCSKINLLALEAIPRYYEKQELDSIEVIMDFVALQCIETPILRLTRFLLLIEQHRFSDSILTKLDLYYIKKESRYLQKGHLYDLTLMGAEPDNSATTGTVHWFSNNEDIEKRYIGMINEWTQKLAFRNDNDPLESAVINQMYVTNDGQTRSGLWGLSARKNGYKSLPQTYNDYHREYVILRSWQATIGGGAFYSTGNLRSLMGSRPSLIFSIGKNFGHPKNRIDFGGTFTFGNSLKPYRIVRPDTSFFSNDGYASFAYLDFVRNLWRPNRFLEWNVSLGGGIAEKGIYSRMTEDESMTNEPAERINNAMGRAFIIRPAAFAGSEFKFFLNSGFAFNLQARYSLFNWGKIGSTSFKGNVLTISAGLTLHFGGHPASSGSNFFGNL